MAAHDLWYKNAILYCLDVEKYMDANGDGTGDFEGLHRRLEYLAGLGAHDRDRLAVSKRDEPIQLGGEHRALHVVGVRTERRILPRAVDGIGLLAPQAAEPGEMRVADAGAGESRRQRVDIELGMAARARHLADVGDVTHAVGADERDEVLQRMRRMTDGPHAASLLLSL